MRKTGLLAIVVLVAAALGLPGVFGGMTQTQVGARVAQINEHGSLDVSVEEYRRGWFTSTAELTVRLTAATLERLDANAPERPAWLSGAGALPVRVVLAHGPAGFNDGPFLGLAKVVAHANPDDAGVRETLETYGLPYLFEFRSRTGFTGRVVFEAAVPPLDTAITGGDTRLSALAIDGTLTGNHLVAALEIEQLDAAAPDLSILASGVRAAADLRFLGYSETVGTASLDVAELGVSGPAAAPGTPGAGSLQVTGLHLTSEAELDDGAWRTRFEYRSDAVRTSDGPRVDAAAFGIGVAGIEAEALASLQALLGSGTDPATGEPELAPGALEAALNRILAGAPSLELAPIRFSREGEAFDASVRLEARDGARLDLAALAANPMNAMGLFNGTADATIAKPLARRLAAGVVARARVGAQPGADPNASPELAETQAALMLVVLTGQGYLDETEDAYSTQLRLQDGSVTINGETPPAFGLP